MKENLKYETTSNVKHPNKRQAIGKENFKHQTTSRENKLNERQPLLKVKLTFKTIPNIRQPQMLDMRCKN